MQRPGFALEGGEMQQTVDQARTCLRQQEIVGVLHPHRAGFGWGTATKMWFKASKKERKELVISEVMRMEVLRDGSTKRSRCEPMPARGMDNLGGYHQQRNHMG